MVKNLVGNVSREELFVSGHNACGGCGQAIATRMVMKAIGKDVIIVNATGCLETVTAGGGITAWEVPWIHSTFENAAAVASGVEAALKSGGRKGIKVVAIAGDGGTFDIGFGMLSGMVDRRHEVMYICMDNQEYGNTGYQKSSSTLPGTATATTPVGSLSRGKIQPKKDLPQIMVANGAVYVATASPAFPVDLIAKVCKGKVKTGPAYIQIDTPCPTGHGFRENKTIEIARIAVETGLVPLFEFENGKLISSMQIKNKLPVQDYLKRLGWFKHLFNTDEGNVLINNLQNMANENIAKYNL
jgi:pyruvate ferredoxin oxidoreductase beta subunit